jgi:tetratricopeptide (TPR) repeat protein
MWIGLIFLFITPKLYKEAQDAYAKGEFEIARKKIEQFIIKYPDEKKIPDALFLAATLRRDGKEALNYYKKIVTKYPKSRQAPNALYRIAQYFYAKREYNEAIKNYKKIISNYPKSRRAQDAKKWIRIIRSFYFIQIGSFSNSQNAWKLAEEFKVFDPIIVKEDKYYKVWIGIFSTPTEGREFMVTHKLKGFTRRVKY